MNIPEGYAQANFRFTGSGLPSGAEIAIGYDVSETSLDPTDLAEALRGDWTTADMGDMYTNTVAMTQVLVKYGPNSIGPSGVAAATATGVQNAPQAPPNCCVLFRKSTAFGGRAGRGRIYLPAPPDAAIESNGAIGSSYLAAFGNRFNEFFLENVSHNVTPVLLHGAGSPLVTPTPIVSTTMDALSATQRRRLRR